MGWAPASLRSRMASRRWPKTTSCAARLPEPAAVGTAVALRGADPLHERATHALRAAGRCGRRRSCVSRRRCRTWLRSPSAARRAGDRRPRRASGHRATGRARAPGRAPAAPRRRPTRATLPATADGDAEDQAAGERLEADVAEALGAVGGQDGHGGHARPRGSTGWSARGSRAWPRNAATGTTSQMPADPHQAAEHRHAEQRVVGQVRRTATTPAPKLA